MKDYSNNLYDYERYILSYKIKNGKIIAKLANGGSYTIPYTEENEKSVISRMETQAREAYVEPLSGFAKIMSILQPLVVLPLAILNFIDYGGLLFGVVLGMVTFSSIFFPALCIINVIKRRDIEKLNYFLRYQEELNDNVLNNENMLINVSEKAVNQIKKQQVSGEKIFNINNIDSYSLSDLRTLKENLDRINSFCFDEDESTLEEQGPILKKKKKLGSKK